MKRNGPEFRIVGNSDNQNKDAAKRRREDAFFKQNSFTEEQQKLLTDHELPKSAKQLAIIRFADELVNELLRNADIKPFEVPPENIHILPRDQFREFSDSDAMAIAMHYHQAILLDSTAAEGNPLEFASTIVHELLHLKAAQTIQVSDGEEPSVYRVGISAHSSIKRAEEIGDHEHGRGLHEAIVALAEKTIYRRLLDLPEFAAEKEWVNSAEYEAAKQEIHAREGVPLDEFIWISKDGKSDSTFTYWTERNTLLYVCDAIRKSSSEYDTVDAVVTEFTKAHLSGRLLPIARLVEKTFGEGSFRVLMNMDVGRLSASLTREHLAKMRSRVLNR